MIERIFNRSDAPDEEPDDIVEDAGLLARRKELIVRMKRDKSPLLEYGLVDDTFLNSLSDYESINFLHRLEGRLAQNGSRLTHPSPDFLGFLMEHKVITPSDFQRHAVAPYGVSEDLAELLMPDEGTVKKLTFLAEAGILSAHTFWRSFAHGSKNFLARALWKEKIDWWKQNISSGVFNPKLINILSSGLDTIEVAALERDLLDHSEKARRYPLVRDAHPLAKKMRSQEHVDDISAQIDSVLKKNPEILSLVAQFKRVFDTYLMQSLHYAEIIERDKISEKERSLQRKKNILLVNKAQKPHSQYRNPEIFDEAKYDTDKRHFDIYARYDDYGMMDPFQLAIIARAAHWYIEGGRSKLFSDIRVVPYATHGEKHVVPYVVLAMCPGAKLINVSGQEFLSTMRGANRTFFTHSQAKDASNMGSIPIIGLATLGNPVKRPARKDEYVVFRADFDPKDPYRSGSWRNLTDDETDVAGNIPGLIDETLRVLLEVENKEIKRAYRRQGSLRSQLKDAIVRAMKS